MKVNFIGVVALLIVMACVSKKGPVNNSEFAADHTLTDLQGIYRNKGDAGTSDYNIYLSKLIWPSDEVLDHEHIDYVEVLLHNNNMITLMASREGKLVKEGQFFMGKDFSFEKGRIVLNREGGVTGLKTGEPLLGLYSGKVTLGLDKKGHGKFRSSSKAIGMVYLIIPVAVKTLEDVRFERIELDSFNQ